MSYKIVAYKFIKRLLTVFGLNRNKTAVKRLEIMIKVYKKFHEILKYFFFASLAVFQEVDIDTLKISEICISSKCEFQ
ncbi:MAG: hypothetical protein LUC34_06010 [Campylobacter sp.]|nr:hypothetical protein [Campylobacter sp.]